MYFVAIKFKYVVGNYKKKFILSINKIFVIKYGVYCKKVMN